MGTGVKHSAGGKNSFKAPEGRAPWILFIPSFLQVLSVSNSPESVTLSPALSETHTHTHRVQSWAFLRHSDWLRGDSDQPAPTQNFTVSLVNTNFVGNDPFQIKRHELQEEAEMKE